ncbi:hypothetical protein FRACYDRAFT_238244 [Fragilariopsis cylindrus CCMP1102]|uniref:WD40 repeat-like protein n=1 Tax=Fragilariopsis cylindrus CCMP1102 TaxID=635003 RepID=A0A1E7FI46_9STRA|nr:hypothetical protein FRACYDRAFT_238244 [Fragilariopsis cylindrus CCMP1102]|eukprot:OEU17817.1 hypothetical protein FRACYDRAFT_238244 [Fragilariopsis cylindrus CCMP1102]
MTTIKNNNDTDTDTNTSPDPIPATGISNNNNHIHVQVILKWSKRVFEFDIEIPAGILKDDFDFVAATVAAAASSSSSSSSLMENMETTTTATKKQQELLNLTLMGTAEVVVLAPSSVSSSSVDENKKTIVFIEDMTSREKKDMERRDLLESMKNVTAMIPALQVLPKYRQPPSPPKEDNNNDNEEMITNNNNNNNNNMDVVEDNNIYEETRAYDRLVHGFSQSRIDTLLRRQQQQQQQSKNNEDNEKKDAVKKSSISPPLLSPSTDDDPKTHLLGKSVMTFGLELQRSYVNDLAVLSNTDGTLISGSDDGHIQLWKNCRRLCDVIHQPPGGSGSGSGNDSFKGVDSVIALDNNTNNEDDTDDDDDSSSSIAFATAGRNCIRIWNTNAESILCVPSPPGYNASPTGLVRVPMTSHNNNNNNVNTVLCLASRYQIDRPQSRLSSRLVPQDEEGRRRHAAIEATETIMNTSLTTLSKTIQILVAVSTTSSTSSSESNNANSSPPTVRSVFLTTTSPVTALVAWEEHTGDNHGSFLAVGDDQGGITIWKISMTAISASPSTINDINFHFQKFRHYQLVLPDNPLQTRSAIVCMSYIDETNQLIVSTREIASTLPAPTPMDLALSTVVVPITRPQAVHCLHIDTSERNNIVHQPSSSPSSLSTISNDCLLFTLDGHKDVVQCTLPLPNGDIITAGGKYDATLQIWSQSQLKEATTTSTATTHDNSNNNNNNKSNRNSSSETTISGCPPTILKKAAIDNFCKEVGYVFAIECLKDFKNDKNSNNPTNTCNYFAIAVARYNVVKLII